MVAHGWAKHEIMSIHVRHFETAPKIGDGHEDASQIFKVLGPIGDFARGSLFCPDPIEPIGRPLGVADGDDLNSRLFRGGAGRVVFFHLGH